jgi:hypothetical protein
MTTSKGLTRLSSVRSQSKLLPGKHPAMSARQPYRHRVLTQEGKMEGVVVSQAPRFMMFRSAPT